MSNLAEYARRLHKRDYRVYERVLTPRGYRSAARNLKGVRAVIADVYGTLVNYWRPGFESRETREALLLGAFSEIADIFGMAGALSRMNPDAEPAATLRDFYNGLIALNREKAVSKGIAFPEVRVEEAWSVILMMLKRNGYDLGANTPEISHLNSRILRDISHQDGSISSNISHQSSSVSSGISHQNGMISKSPDTDIADFARYLAYTYNFLSMGRQLYPNVTNALKKLKDGNIVLGIVADAQLYTPIDLTLLIREQSGGKIDDYNELFDPDLTFFSYEYGFVKPSEALFRRLFDALYEYHILPSQTVFIGNDLAADIRPAALNGMKTALFCGDGIMVFGADGGGVVPDIVFDDWDELPGMLSFHGGTDQ